MQNASKRYRRDPEKICNKLIAFVEPLLLILIDVIRIWCLSGMFNDVCRFWTTTSDIHTKRTTYSLSWENFLQNCANKERPQRFYEAFRRA